jgi:dolichol-phosphate mannosyltransferase
MDGNDKDDPAAIPGFIGALESGCQHIQGSRYVPGGVELNTPFMRKWGVRLLHAPLVRLAAGWPYTDTTNGFRAYAREFLDDPRVAPFRSVFTGYELHYYLAIRAARLGYRVCEVPVTRAYPAAAPAPTKITPIRGNLRVLRALFAACLNRFDPPSAPRGRGHERLDR